MINCASKRWCMILPPLNITKEDVKEICAAWTERYFSNRQNEIEYYWRPDLYGILIVVGKHKNETWKEVLGDAASI